MTTDAQGRLRVSGFLGEYEVSAGQGRAPLRLEEKGPVETEVRLPG
jgi:hypothetical protein